MKIAFIDHSFHKKTKSNLFLKDILAEQHLVIDFWLDSWTCHDFNPEEINKGQFDLVLFFQIMPLYRALKKVECKNIVYVPMYDSILGNNMWNWLAYLALDIKILSFSDTLFLELKRIGLDVFKVQYYPVPDFQTNDTHKLSIFFWQRIQTINWELLKKLLGNSPVEKIVLRSTLAPGTENSLPNSDDMEKYKIEILDGWLEKDKYEALFKSCNLFFAPRDYEGIGMSFLEAMALGIPVLAPDLPTMNEYIKDGDNGYLYEINNPLPIDFTDLPRIRENLKETMLKGFDKWQSQKGEIVRFIEKPPVKKVNIKVMAFKTLNFLKGLLKK